MYIDTNVFVLIELSVFASHLTIKNINYYIVIYYLITCRVTVILVKNIRIQLLNCLLFRRIPIISFLFFRYCNIIIVISQFSLIYVNIVLAPNKQISLHLFYSGMFTPTNVCIDVAVVAKLVSGRS